MAEMSYDECRKIVAENYGTKEEEGLSPDLEAASALMYMEQQPVEKVEERLLSVIRSYPMPAQYLAVPAMVSLQKLYNRYSQKGAISQPGATETLKDYPLLCQLLRNSDATCQRLASQQLIQNSVSRKGGDGLKAPVSARGGLNAIPALCKISAKNLFEKKIDDFFKAEAADILAGPATSMQYRLLAEKFIAKNGINDLKEFTKDDFAISVASSLLLAVKANNPDMVLSAREQWKFEKLGQTIAGEFAIFLGTKITIELGNRVAAYAGEQLEEWKERATKAAEPREQEKCQQQLAHYEAILQRLCAKGVVNPLAAMDAKLFKDFPIIGAEVLHDFGLPGGVENNLLSVGIKDYGEWKEATDAVYFAIADIATSIYKPAAVAVKGVNLSLKLSKKMRELNQTETFYSQQERFGRAVVEMAVETGVNKVFDAVADLGLKGFKVSERYPQVTMDAIKSQYKFLLKDVKKETGEKILP